MKRTVRKREPRVRPVERIELSEKNMRLRAVFAIIFVVIAIGAFAYTMISRMTKESGWREIEVDSSAQTNCSAEFVFQYRLGESGVSATEEYKRISQIYTSALDESYMLFSLDAYENCVNLYYLNEHPNEAVQVDPLLYDAFALLDSYQSRYLYFAPVYEQYRSLFGCVYDYETADVDPYQNEEQRDYFAEIAAFANDPASISIELLSDSQVRLSVSEAYLRYAEENGFTAFIDFFWLKNAFILDHALSMLSENGYCLGVISSYDGFSGSLDDSGTSYSTDIFDRIGKNIYPAGQMDYSVPIRLVSFRDFPVTSTDTLHYYVMENGDTRTPYIDLADGLCKSAVSSLTAFSTSNSCAAIAIQMLPVYTAETFDLGLVRAASQDGIETVYCADQVIYCTDPTITFSALYDMDGVSYSVSSIS